MSVTYKLYDKYIYVSRYGIKYGIICDKLLRSGKVCQRHGFSIYKTVCDEFSLKLIPNKVILSYCEINKINPHPPDRPMRLLKPHMIKTLDSVTPLLIPPKEGKTSLNDLPYELLVQIFELSCQGKPKTKHYKTMYNWTRVNNHLNSCMDIVRDKVKYDSMTMRTYSLPVFSLKPNDTFDLNKYSKLTFLQETIKKQDYMYRNQYKYQTMTVKYKELLHHYINGKLRKIELENVYAISIDIRDNYFLTIGGCRYQLTKNGNEYFHLKIMKYPYHIYQKQSNLIVNYSYVDKINSLKITSNDNIILEYIYDDNNIAQKFYCRHIYSVKFVNLEMKDGKLINKDQFGNVIIFDDKYNIRSQDSRTITVFYKNHRFLQNIKFPISEYNKKLSNISMNENVIKIIKVVEKLIEKYSATPRPCYSRDDVIADFQYLYSKIQYLNEKHYGMENITHCRVIYGHNHKINFGDYDYNTCSYNNNNNIYAETDFRDYDYNTCSYNNIYAKTNFGDYDYNTCSYNNNNIYTKTMYMIKSLGERYYTLYHYGLNDYGVDHYKLCKDLKYLIQDIDTCSSLTICGR